jgi:hypothetical protein
MMVVMVVSPMRNDDAHGAAEGVVMMMVVVVRRDLEFASPRLRHGPLFVDGEQQGAGIRDRLQQIGVGVSLQNSRGRRSRRGLCRAKSPERGHRSQ